MATNKIINEPERVVVDMLEGIVAVHPHLQLLDGLPDIKVVVTPPLPSRTVAVISGGGSGHEPAHAGYVGAGMLCAAVCGDVFASPSADAVLAAIRAVSGAAGCLLVVKNYTGDRLHFGLAAEQAKAEGIAVEVVVVCEDCAIDAPGIAGARGLAGTALVHKVAGAAAATGRPLAEVAALARAVATSCATYGCALSVCSLPGQPPPTRLAPGHVELGLGIHGEPGVRQCAALPAHQLVSFMLESVVASLRRGGSPPAAAGSSSSGNGSGSVRLSPGSPVALLVNNLGATPPSELYVAAGAAARQLQDKHGLCLQRMYAGHFMTSLDMAGVSLTVLDLAAAAAAAGGSPADLLALLDAPTTAPAWPVAQQHEYQPNKARVPLLVPSAPPDGGGATAAGRPAQLSPQGAQLEAAILAACKALVEAAPRLNELDAKVGDGDCGSTLKHGAEAVAADCAAARFPLDDADATLAAMAASVRHAVGGTSGALYDIGLTAAARCMKEQRQQAGGSDGGVWLPSAAWAAALATAAQAMQLHGGASLGCRTMLDALLPASSALSAALESGASAREAAEKAAAAACEGAQATIGMVAAAGRSSYVPVDVLRTVPDPGAMGVAAWLQAVAAAIRQ